MKKILFNKGELTTQQIVMLTILIVGFVIILIFLFLLNPGELTQKQICHNSVVLKGKSANLVGELDCSIDYVCISGGGECEGLPLKQRVVKVDSEDKEEIMGAVAEEMAECWWMYGEGDVDYVSGNFKGKTACAVCSIIAFDVDVDDVSYNDFYSFLLNEKEEGQSYLDYIYNRNSVSQFRSSFPIRNYLQNQFDFDRQYFVLTGMTKSPVWDFFGWVGISDSGHIPVTVLEKTNSNYREVGCDEFLTKV